MTKQTGQIPPTKQPNPQQTLQGLQNTVLGNGLPAGNMGNIQPQGQYAGMQNYNNQNVVQAQQLHSYLSSLLGQR